MKICRYNVLLIFSSILFFATPFVQAHDMFGIGPAIGNPIGISADFELDLDQSIDAFVGWSGGTHRGTQLHSDYLQIVGPVAAVNDQQLFFYWGAGGRATLITDGKDQGKMALGPRVPVGLETELRNPAWKFFAEAALVLEVIPSTTLDTDLLLGGRYYF